MMTSLYDYTYSFRCSVAKARLTLIFKLRLKLLIHSTKTLSLSSIHRSRYNIVHKKKRATAQCCM